MSFLAKRSKNELPAHSSGQKRRRKKWRELASVLLCATLLSTSMVGVLAAEPSASPVSEVFSATEGDGQNLETLPISEGGGQNTTNEDEEATYTLHLTHVFRFTEDGKNRSVQASEEITLTEADFVDGVCDLTRFALDVEQLTVTRTQVMNLENELTTENVQYGAQIIYAVASGWKMVRKENAAEDGIVLRDVFQGKLDNYEFVPAKVVQMNVKYQYSSTGGLAGIDAAAPATIEAVPVEQNGTYKVTFDLPTVEGFRIVLNPIELNKYVVDPPTGNETAAELEEKLENGAFDVDIANHTIYYYQQIQGGTTNPTYQNRYSTEYNEAWNAARTLAAANYTATAVGDNNNRGANPLENPRLEVTLTETQLNSVLSGTTNLDITVYYRRNATWYTVNHWVPTALAGTVAADAEKDTVDGTEYVRLNQETLQGRVGAMTRAKTKTVGVYEQLQTTGFSQKLIENQDTVVDIYYKAADSYRVIFDTDYTYIPRQQVELGKNVNFANITAPKRTGYTFGGWRYLKKNAVANKDGSYNDDQYTELNENNPELMVDEALIAAAKLTESGGVLALHLYPKWEPAKTQVRVILWTEDLTGEDDVQALAAGGNTTYYDGKYADYRDEPVTHEPQLGMSNSHYSNMGSFTVTVDTDSSLLENNTLLTAIQTQVTNGFKTAMGQASGIDVANFYTQAAFQIVHEEEDKINYTTTTASADGKTSIYVYFTRNIYTLQFHYYGAADNFDCAVATHTNGYSNSSKNGDSLDSGGNFNYDYLGKGTEWENNKWVQVIESDKMPVPQTITIRAKYGANLREVWPAARVEETIATRNGYTAGSDTKMISWATTLGKYCEDGRSDAANSTHKGESTIMGIYSAMSSEIIANPEETNTTHHLVAYWNGNTPSYYRYNHCYEVPELNVNGDGIQKVSIYNDDTGNAKNFLYLVPTDNAAIAKYDFNDLMLVSYVNGRITYNDPNGTYYAVRAYNGSYYAVARRVVAMSTNAINMQNPSARLHLSRANTTADHTTQYQDTDGAANDNNNPNKHVGSEDNPYDLYFYYNRDRYTITYMAPSNNSSTATEVTLGTVELPYGALVTQDKYGFELYYEDQNTNNKYSWTPADETPVCPDRHEDGAAVWQFKGWGLGPAGVNMQWTVNENTGTEAQAGDDFAIESNLRLYAIWDAPTYTVTFHLNGGTFNGSDGNIEENVPANRRYSSTENLIPRPLRNGYTLAGWYLADENGNIAENASTFDFDSVIAADQHVAAKWSAVSTVTFSYTIYYVTDKLKSDDTTNDETVWIHNDEIAVENTGTKYYVLHKTEQKGQMFIANSSLNFSAIAQPGYVPQQTNQILTMGQAGDTYNVIFYYDPIAPGQHVVQFVEAGTETSANLTLVKTLTVNADQTVVTPQSAVAKELVGKGYALVNRAGDAGQYTYTQVNDAAYLKWYDANGNERDTATLKGDAIPQTVTYLVQPIPYTITYQNATGSPAAANAALDAVTAATDTPVASADGKNPTLYTTKDTFTAKNPARVYDDADKKWYKFTGWDLGTETTVVQPGSTAGQKNPLTVEAGSVGNLTFLANWAALTDDELGSLTVSKTVAGNAGETNKDFTFTVTLSDANVSNTYGDMTFTNGVATFTLKHSESKTATGLPKDITYTVSETEANQDGYTTTSNGTSGTITAGNTVTAAFTNTKNSGTVPDPDQTGSLRVSKTVTGAAGETDREFHFTVELGKPVTGKYGDMTFANGIATFTLKDGETRKAIGLPAGISYTVSEAEANQDGYTTTASAWSGVIVNNSVVQFYNHRGDVPGEEEEKPLPPKPDQPDPVEPDKPDPEDPVEPEKPVEPEQPDPEKPTEPEKPAEPSVDKVPQTSDETDLALWMMIMVASGIGLVSALVLPRRLNKREKHTRHYQAQHYK